ncbi:MAG: replicative DNA helicase [Actinomycetota bacterium]|nr:replicative DNA helicase [Actinomycetota bacterium]
MVRSLDDARRQPGAARARIPPHDLQAEESLLGAMLLSRDAIVEAVQLCTGEDFYKPAHGHVFEAVCSLYGQGEPADPVTVADELRRADLLEAIGGLASLVSLQANTPATSNARRYAQIVEEHALLRRLIGVASEIAELGYELPEDVSAAVDRAESMVFEVAQRRVTTSTRPLRELLADQLDRLEALYERGESITGVPTGYTDLDEMLAGLQPSNLVIVGARPSMGKALAVETRIPTPDGWTTMGDVVEGSQVLDEHGRPCRVTYVSPVYSDHQCYQVRFDDGSVLVADAEHQWFAYDFPAWKSHRERADRMARVVTTQQMLDEGVLTTAGRSNWYLPLVTPLDGPDVDLEVDPYVLGCWLGDATRKHIPGPYLRASFKQRLSLLQGLMDVSGTEAGEHGQVELRLANRHLLEQARELVCTMGHKPGQIVAKWFTALDGRRAQAWCLTWTPLDPVFRLGAKGDRGAAPRGSRSHVPNGRHTRRSVVAVEPVDAVPVRCLTVDSPRSLYLAGDSMIPTHNTSLALGMGAHAAMDAQVPVLIFSLEMSHLELTQRMLCSEARVDAQRMRTGKLHESDWSKVANAVGRLGEAPIYIDDNPNITVMDIRAKARRQKAREGLGLVIVDYLQLMSSRARVENRQLEVSEISRNLKVLARELEVPVLALSQLSRNLETRADKRPLLADLRESGSIEQDADVVMFIYRDEIYNPESAERGTAEILVAKHRNGPTGKTELAFLGQYTRFANMARL